MAPLQEIVKFFQNKEAYEPPTDYKLLFEAFCLGHFLTVFEFTSVLCEFIGVDDSKVSPMNLSPKEIKKLIRDRLKAIAHYKRVAGGKCKICHGWLSGTDFTLTPCCSKQIHEDCMTDLDECTLCREPFTLLSCCVCKEQIEVFGTPMEGYKMQQELRTPCCGADMHYICRTVDLLSPENVLPVCPVCCIPITHDGRVDHRSPGDVFHAERQLKCNNHQRRRKMINYTKPYSST